MAFSLLLTARPAPYVTQVTLQRPDAANALSGALAEEIAAAFAALPADCRVVILSGEGKHFCAGADLKEREGADRAAWEAQHHHLRAARDAVLSCPVPVIAAVRGAAFGGGLELALTCDFIYAAEDARFALPEATLGIMPGLGGASLLAARIGTAGAREMLYTGQAINAAEAKALGLVRRVFSAESLQEETLAVARIIAANAPLSVRAIKRAMHADWAEAFARERGEYLRLVESDDRREGISAFHAKRPPVFSGA